MTVIKGYPPNIEQIKAVLGPCVTAPNVIFCYAPNLYTFLDEIPDALIAHEAVHMYQQTNYPGGAEAWWDAYLTSTLFRYTEELAAHRTEYQYVLKQKPNRHDRRRALAQIAGRLSGPLYGNAVSLETAKKVISE